MPRTIALPSEDTEIRNWTMSDEHKQALAEGRTQGRAIREYLDALNTYQPKRGRKRTPDSIKNRLEAIENALPTADTLSRLKMVQERMDLERSLDALNVGDELLDLQDKFIAVAAQYGARKGITYGAWRSLGVPVEVLREAGITRTNAR